MPVSIPLLVQRASVNHLGHAFFVASDSVKYLRSIPSLFDSEDTTQVFQVSDGYLICRDMPFKQLPPGLIRLHRLHEDFFIPVDGELNPYLLGEEVSPLVQEQGLILLPDGRILGFDPNFPVKPSDLLKVHLAPSRGWQPIPTPPVLIDRIHSIHLEVPPKTMDEFLQPSDPTKESEDSKPPKTGLGKSILGSISTRTGQAISGFGNSIGAGFLARLGQEMMAMGMNMAPQLKEKILGQQQAALERLLSLFKEGKTEEALRKAIAFSEDVNRGGQMDASADLREHDIGYSLAGLLGGGRGEGRIVYWQTPDQIRQQLLQEYRRLAEEAVQKGDHRRAAYIYGGLLGDYGMAADVLAKGGLHRDAAILFRDKAHQPIRAARHFELAGEYDEALRLYRQQRAYLEAGDLLKTIGELEAAKEEYLRAANQIIEQEKNYLGAGDLLLNKAAMLEEAKQIYLQGWQQRNNVFQAARNALPCCLKWMELECNQGNVKGYWQRFEEAEEWLDHPGRRAEATQFFNTLVKRSQHPAMEPYREEIRDRCRMGLAIKLKQHADYERRSGKIISELFGQHNHWPAELITDAQFAIRQEIRTSITKPKEKRPYRVIRIAEDNVTCATHSVADNKIFLGFEKSGIYVFDLVSNITRQVFLDHGNFVYDLAVTPLGSNLICLNRNSIGTTYLSSYFVTEQKITMQAIREIDKSETPIQIAHVSIDAIQGLQTIIDRGSQLGYFIGPKLLNSIIKEPFREKFANSALLLKVLSRNGQSVPFIFQSSEFYYGNQSIAVGWSCGYAQCPYSSYRRLALSHLLVEPGVLEVAGVTTENVFYWSLLEQRGHKEIAVRTRTYNDPKGFTSVACIKAHDVAAVTTNNRILWLRMIGSEVEQWAAETQVEVAEAIVDCFAFPLTQELVCVLHGGEIVRVPIPI